MRPETDVMQSVETGEVELGCSRILALVYLVSKTHLLADNWRLLFYLQVFGF